MGASGKTVLKHCPHPCRLQTKPTRALCIRSEQRPSIMHSYPRQAPLHVNNHGRTMKYHLWNQLTGNARSPEFKLLWPLYTTPLGASRPSLRLAELKADFAATITGSIGSPGSPLDTRHLSSTVALVLCYSSKSSSRHGREVYPCFTVPGTNFASSMRLATIVDLDIKSLEIFLGTRHGVCRCVCHQFWRAEGNSGLI